MKRKIFFQTLVKPTNQNFSQFTFTWLDKRRPNWPENFSFWNARTLRISDQKFKKKISFSRYDQLIRAGGKSLSHKVYCLISYVEEKQKPDKVIRETKFLPKLVLHIETFNKYVIFLSKKTNFDSSSYIHIGRVRYFRIKDLQDVLDRTMENGIEVDESNMDEQEVNEDSLSDSESNAPDDNSSETASTLTSSNGSEVGMTKTKLLRNMERIKKEVKRAHKVSAKEKEAPPSKRRKMKSKNV